MRRPTSIAIALCATLVLAGPTAPVAGAALSSSQLGELAAKAQQEEASSTASAPANSQRTSEEKEANSSIPSSVALLGIGAIVVLLGGIAFVIVRDSRSVAPAVEGPGEGAASRKSEVQLRKRRAKAKAARAQRKRNR